MQKALEVSGETSQSFSNQVIQELEKFNVEKQEDFKKMFKAHTFAQLEFHEKGLDFWNEMIPIVESIRLEDS